MDIENRIAELKIEIDNIENLYVEEFSKIYNDKNFNKNKTKVDKILSELSAKYAKLSLQKENELFELESKKNNRI